jgi:predicted kinase
MLDVSTEKITKVIFNMAKCYQLIGVPASGKSTWVKNQEWAVDCAYVSTDMWVDLEAERQGKTYNEIFTDYMPHAVKLMANHVELARDKGMDIIWDQTSTTVKSRARKFNMLRDYEHIAVVFKTPEADELARRLASRPGKNIPDHVMRSMINYFEMPDEEEGFKEIWHAT